MFASAESIRSRRVSWEKGPASLEIIGTPDMVMEVVSKTSIQKDTVVLRTTNSPSIGCWCDNVADRLKPALLGYT